MEYVNMPHSCADYYQESFEYVRDKLSVTVSDLDINTSVEALKSFNPRINYRETELSPEYIFEYALKHWKADFDLNEAINIFFENMKLTPFIYPDAIPVLKKLKTEHRICALTDTAAGMPDSLHKSYFPSLLEYFDVYVSSLSCGFRKPNPFGLKYIAEYFSVSTETLVFIGDEEKDIKTAINAGCTSVLIDRSKILTDYGQDYTIATLYEMHETEFLLQTN